MSDLSYTFGEANRDFDLLSRTAFILGVSEDCRKIILEIQNTNPELVAHEDLVRSADAILKFDPGEMHSVHSRIDFFFQDPDAVTLWSLKNNTSSFVKHAENTFKSFSEELTTAQQVYAVLYTAEALLKTMDVGYKPRAVHEREEALTDIDGPTDEDLAALTSDDPIDAAYEEFRLKLGLE